MTQDVYLGRKAKNAGNLDALEALNPDGLKDKSEEADESLSWANENSFVRRGVPCSLRIAALLAG